jgi:hypothetical protein
MGGWYAKHILCHRFTVDFQVIAPDGGYVTKKIGSNIYHADKNLSSVGFLGQLHLLPETVSFYNVDFREGGGVAQATGYYKSVPGIDGLPHPTGSWFTVFADNTVDAVDIINAGSFTGPFEYGTFRWPIMWEYKVGQGTVKTIGVVKHFQVSDTIKASIQKGEINQGSDGPFSKNHSDPFSNYY